MNKFLLFSFLVIMSCNPSITLVNAEKQTIIPGRPNLKPYSNYHIDFLIKDEVAIVIDSVKVIEDKMIYNTSFSLQKKGKASYIKQLTEKGTYTLQVPLKKQNIRSSKATNQVQNRLIIFYSEDNTFQKLEITSFKNKTITRR